MTKSSSVSMAECHLVNGIFALGKPESAVTECPCAMELTCIADDDGPRVEGAKGKDVSLSLGRHSPCHSFPLPFEQTAGYLFSLERETERR